MRVTGCCREGHAATTAPSGALEYSKTAPFLATPPPSPLCGQFLSFGKSHEKVMKKTILVFFMTFSGMFLNCFLVVMDDPLAPPGGNGRVWGIRGKLLIAFRCHLGIPWSLLKITAPYRPFTV